MVIDEADQRHDPDVVVIGGGQAGLATGYYLRRAQVPFVILDDQPAPGGAWRHTWPSLTLFSTAGFSNLPGIPMPPYDGFPPAGHVIEYLSAYEARYDLPVVRPVHVERVTHASGVFHVRTDVRTWRARAVVSATGTWSRPFVPWYPGSFSGQQWHSAHYPGPEPFTGSRVAVVGGANSGAQIAAELGRVADLTWYTPGPPRWMPDDIDGRVLFRRNHQRMLALLRGEPDPGAADRLGDIVMVPSVLEARDSGRLVPTPMFGSLDDVAADHLVWCTGFRPALGHLRGLLSGRTPTVPGLHLVGYGDWTGPGSATLAGVAPGARQAAEEIEHRSVGRVG